MLIIKLKNYLRKNNNFFLKKAGFSQTFIEYKK